MIGRSKFNERLYDMTPNGESLDISETQKIQQTSNADCAGVNSQVLLLALGELRT